MGVTAVRPVKETTLTCELSCRKTYCMKLNKHKSEFHPLVEKAENLTQPSWNTKPPAESLRACVYKRSHCIILDWITSFSNKKYSTAPWISRTCVMLELNHNVNPTHKKIQEFSRHKKGGPPSVNFHRRFGYWTLKTHHAELLLPRQSFSSSLLFKARSRKPRQAWNDQPAGSSSHAPLPSANS